jgi:hypothetical protein
MEKENCEKIAIHGSREGNELVKFVPLSKFPKWVQKIRLNCDMWGIYYDEENNLVCEDKSGNIRKIYFASSEQYNERGDK